MFVSLAERERPANKGDDVALVLALGKTYAVHRTGKMEWI